MVGATDFHPVAAGHQNVGAPSPVQARAGASAGNPITVSPIKHPPRSGLHSSARLYLRPVAPNFPAANNLSVYTHL